MADTPIAHFRLSRILNQDQHDRRLSLLGTIDDAHAILLVERAAFANDPSSLAAVLTALGRPDAVATLGTNDVYHWFLGWIGGGDAKSLGAKDGHVSNHADVKVNLIWPATEQHIRKYAAQAVRMVTETPAVYRAHVRPYMAGKREGGRLQWVENILDGITETDAVVFRSPGHVPSVEGEPDPGFILIPDLNWDRHTRGTLHLLALVQRRDLWSLRDLTTAHLPWLRVLREEILDATVAAFPPLERDQLKLYFHYQPTYYHLHIHVVNVMLEAGGTQAAGKAILFDAIIAQLVLMATGGGSGETSGMADIPLSYTVGEQSELWTDIFKPMKEGKLVFEQ